MLLLRYLRRQKPPQFQHAAVRVQLFLLPLMRLNVIKSKWAFFKLLANWSWCVLTCCLQAGHGARRPGEPLRRRNGDGKRDGPSGAGGLPPVPLVHVQRAGAEEIHPVSSPPSCWTAAQSRELTKIPPWVQEINDGFLSYHVNHMLIIRIFSITSTACLTVFYRARQPKNMAFQQLSDLKGNNKGIHKCFQSDRNQNKINWLKRPLHK